MFQVTDDSISSAVYLFHSYAVVQLLDPLSTNHQIITCCCLFLALNSILL